MSEPFSWTKFFGGIVDPTAYFKTLAITLRVCIIALIMLLIYCAGVKIHAWLFPKKPVPITFTVSNQVGGTVKNSADQKKTNFGLFNF